MAYVGTPIDTINQFQSLQGKRFSGDASTTAFTLDIAPNSVFDIEVFVENVRQDPNSAYGINGTTLTFTGAPPSGTNNIYVVHQAKAVGTIDVPASGVVPASLASNIISGQTELAATPADTDEFLISDAGTIKRVDYSYIKAANTPSFKATMSGDQTISVNTNTKIQFDTESFDTNSAYDHTTNYRFTVPSGEGGKYYVTLFAHTSAGTSNSEAHRIAPFVNGAISDVGFMTRRFGDANTRGMGVSGILTLSESDYVEAYIRLENATIIYQKPFWEQTYFSMFKLIGV